MGDVRTRVSKTRVRLPYVAVIRDDFAVPEQALTAPPLIAIGILSPEDRLPRMVKRLDEFLAMGVPNVWLIDPVERAAFTYTTAGLKLVEAPLLTIEGSPIHLNLPELFAALD